MVWETTNNTAQLFTVMIVQDGCLDDVSASILVVIDQC